MQFTALLDFPTSLLDVGTTASPMLPVRYTIIRNVVYLSLMVYFTCTYLCSPSPGGTLASSLWSKCNSLKCGTLAREPLSRLAMLLKLRPSLQEKNIVQAVVK